MSIIQWIEKYFWEMLAIGIAPIMGFIVGQYYKAHLRDAGLKRSSLTIATINSVVTFIFAFWFWTGDYNESLKIGAAVGIISPIIVWIWFILGKRWAPNQMKSFKDSDLEDTDEITIIPWVYKKGKTIITMKRPPELEKLGKERLEREAKAAKDEAKKKAALKSKDDINK